MVRFNSILCNGQGPWVGIFPKWEGQIPLPTTSSYASLFWGMAPHLSALPYTRKTHQINPNFIPHLLVRIDKKCI